MTSPRSQCACPRAGADHVLCLLHPQARLSYPGIKSEQGWGPAGPGASLSTPEASPPQGRHAGGARGWVSGCGAGGTSRACAVGSGGGTVGCCVGPGQALAAGGVTSRAGHSGREPARAQGRASPGGCPAQHVWPAALHGPVPQCRCLLLLRPFPHGLGSSQP